MSVYHSRVTKRLMEIEAAHMRSLAEGHPDDYAKYRQVVGVLAGIALALEVLEQVEAELLEG